MFAATQQIASVAGLKATKVQVRVNFVSHRARWRLISKEEDERFFVTAKAIKKKKSRSDEESFLLFFFFFFFSRGEKARAHQSLDERGCFFARFFPLRVDHRSLEDDPPRARERQRESRSRWMMMVFCHWFRSFFVRKDRRFCLSWFRDIFRRKKGRFFTEMKYFVPGV
jgi:hypothetical protein